ncbi:MAG: hypothetical protein EP305_04280 [Bacteroidetes bacterium]|nr:MAG: hypothetical protein EP305_04280 [Bacteroidota bacterium]
MVGIRNISDYSPFGVLLKERAVEAAFFRKGYQGSERDDEIKGKGNSYNTDYRILDPRIGKWLSMDPKKSAWESPYSGMGNNPIAFNDPFGDTIRVQGRDKLNTEYTFLNGKLINSSNRQEYQGGDKFLDQALENLNRINLGGTEGNRLISSISNSKCDLSIQFGLEQANYDPTSGVLTIDFNHEVSVFEENRKGPAIIPQYIKLGHELAHGEDDINGTYNKYKIWYGQQNVSEQYATHVENKLRSENGLGLREFYGVSISERGNKIPIEASRITNGNGSSMFYKTDVTFIFIKQNNGIKSQIFNTQALRPYNYNTDNNDKMVYSLPVELFNLNK